MTNKERLEKLTQAKALIRLVGFSFPQSAKIRQEIYGVVINTFGLGGSLYPLMKELEDLIKIEENSQE